MNDLRDCISRMPSTRTNCSLTDFFKIQLQNLTTINHKKNLLYNNVMLACMHLLLYKRLLLFILVALSSAIISEHIRFPPKLDRESLESLYFIDKMELQRPLGVNLLNEAYRELADYYCTVIIPSRVRKPKDYPEVFIIPNI